METKNTSPSIWSRAYTQPKERPKSLPFHVGVLFDVLVVAVCVVLAVGYFAG